MSTLVRESDIHNEKLINEIKVRPGLYNTDLEEHSDSHFKAKLWAEVTARVFENVWKNLTHHQKTYAVRLVQRRWKNLRACLSRELRKEREETDENVPKKRRRYLYYEQMQFLIPYKWTRKYSKSVSTIEADTEDAPDPLYSSVHLYDTKQSYESEDNALVETASPTASMHINDTKQSFRSRENDDISVEMLTTTNIAADSKDQETYFALSLVPMLRALPFDKKLNAQIQILQVFQRIGCAHRNSTNIQNS